MAENRDQHQPLKKDSKASHIDFMQYIPRVSLFSCDSYHLNGRSIVGAVCGCSCL